MAVRLPASIDFQTQALSVADMRRIWNEYGLLLFRACNEQFIDGEKLEAAIRAHKKVHAMIEYHIARDAMEQEDE